MLGVVLIHSVTEEEKAIAVPNSDRFAEWYGAVRELVPDRRWEIFETYPINLG
jgi:hypothetical protein